MEKNTKIEFALPTHNGSLYHYFFYDKMVDGFIELENMLGEKPAAISRTIVLKKYMQFHSLWRKAHEDYFITRIDKTTDGEHWHFTKIIVK